MASSPAPAGAPRSPATAPTTPKTAADAPKFEPANQNDPKPSDKPAGEGTPPTGPAAASPSTPAPATPDAPTPADQAPPVSEQRQQQIRDWAETKSDHSGGFLGIGGTDSSEKVRDALGGKSELGPMNADEQRVLADRMIDRWDAGRGDGASGASQLVDALGDTPDSRAIVGQQLAARSAQITKDTPLDPEKPDANWERRARATSYARSAVDAAGSADDPASAGRLRESVERLGPEGAGHFARSLVGTNPLGGPSFDQDHLARTLTALDGGPPTEARSAFVQNAFAATKADDYAASPELQRSMAQSIAREWHPDDPAAAQRDSDRLAGILGTDQGRRLLGDGGKDGPALETRVNGLATVRADASITGDKLKETDDPWTNPAIIAPSAQASARQFLDNRGDAPVALSGTDLDNTVGTAMGMPPTIPPGTDPTQAEAAAARGAFNYFGTGENAEAIKKVSDQIRGIAGNGPANVAVLPVTYSDGKTGPVQLPLFRVTDPSGAERYVDNTGRRYDDFDDWRENNKLPPGTQVYPEGGHLTAGPDEKVALGQGNTPETVDSFGEHLSSFVDKAALVGGIVAGGVLIVGTGGLATPAVIAGAGAVAAGAGAWGAYRSGSELADRSEHGQSINPFTDGEARGLWLNLGASVASVGAFGSAARLAQLGKAGRAVAPLEASLHGYTQAGAFALDTAATANMGIYTAQNWDRMSGGERAQSILQMGFWGVGAGVGMRASGTRNPGDMFNPIKVRDNILAANPPATAADPNLPGNAVKIDYDPATGVVQGIRHGPEATPEDIALHQRTAQNIQRSLTLEGQANRLFAGSEEPPPGTVGWAARQDIAKVRERLDTRLKELERPGLTPARRAEIERANDVDRAHLDALSNEVSSFVRDPNAATIDARNTRRIAVDDPVNRPTKLKTAEDVRNARDSLKNQTVEVETDNFTATWSLDGEGQLKVADAYITDLTHGKKRSSNESSLTSAVSREGGRGRTDDTKIVNDRGKTVYDLTRVDDGGHGIGHRFFGDMGLANLFPQNARFNQQDFRMLEDDVASWLEAGAEVRYRVAVGDNPSFNKSARTENGWGADHRPDKVYVEYQVFKPGETTPITKKRYEFANDTSASYRPLRDEFQAANDADLQRLMRQRIFGN